MNKYISSYYDELIVYCGDPTISIRDKFLALSHMRNILVDLRDEIFDMTTGIEVPEEIEGVINIIINKIIRRISYTNKTIDDLLLDIPEDPKHKYLDPEKYSYLKEEEQND